MAKARIEEYVATGKRKEAIARIRLRPGTGSFVVNARALEEYFGRNTLPIVARQPFTVTNMLGKFDVHALVDGGGIAGQAEALRHGIARALVEYSAELKKTLRGAGLLTRDSRIKERKKYGHKKARKSFQYSKR